MTKKIFLSGVFLLCVLLPVKAQITANFQKNVSFEQILTMAKKEGKKVFVDFYTTWCGPCKIMDKEVFTDAMVGKYLNEGFVNLKVDAEKGNGVTLARKYKVNAYPTFLVLAEDGTEVFRMVGARSAVQFVDNLRKGMDPAFTPEALAKRYQNGERNPGLINEYVLSIMKSGDEKKGFEVVNEYFNQLTTEERASKANFFLYERYALSFTDPKIKYLHVNKVDFLKNNDPVIVNALHYRFLRLGLVPYANGYWINQGKFDLDSYNEIRDLCLKADLPEDSGLKALVKVADAQNKKDLAHKLTVCEAEFPNMTKSDRFLLMLTLGQYKTERELAVRATKLINKYIAETNEASAEVLRRVLFELAEKGQSIAFQKLSFQDALDKAKKENKIVFIDCFTDWCGPCKWLDENTFRDPIIVKHFDTNFINLKIDMEKGEGVALSKKLGVTSYPTMFFLDGDGKVLHKVTGSMDGQKLMTEVKKAS